MVAILDYGLVEGNLPAIAMELVEGETLGGRLDRQGAMAWPTALRVLAGQAGEALRQPVATLEAGGGAPAPGRAGW